MATAALGTDRQEDAGMAPALVQAHLERLLSSPGLSSAESLARLLRYVVAETLAGRSAGIKEYTLGVEVFRRGTDFDPRVDTIVRTQARRLRAKLAHYYANEGAGDPVVIELRRGTYVPVFRQRAAAPVASVPWHRWALLAAFIAAAVMLWSLAGPRWTGMAADEPHVALRTFTGPPLLARALWGPERERPATYHLYLKGTMGGKTTESIRYLDEAIRGDPGFAPAWLAKAEILMSRHYRAEQAPVLVLPLARDAAERSLRLGYDSAAVHQILAAAAATLDWDWERSQQSLLRAIELDGRNVWGRLVLAQHLAYRGRASEALEQLRQVRALDASAPVAAPFLASIYFHLRRYERVLDICRAVVSTTSGNRDCYYWMGRALLAKGLAAEAVSAFENGGKSAGQGFGSVVSAYVAAGRRNDALRIRVEAERRAEVSYVSPLSLAQTYFAFGEFEAGFRQLERGLEMRDQSLPALPVDPAYDEVRRDPRFQAILNKMRL